MAQVLKESVRIRISAAAEARFAEQGFDSATIDAIARDAGVAAGTVYKYFPNKQALLYSIVTEEFVAELSRLTRERIASFSRPTGMEPDQDMEAGKSGELLGFLARNRLKAVILLGWGQWTKYADFVPDYIRDMETRTLAQAGEQFPQLEQTRTFRFMVRRILEESVRGMVTILAEFENEGDIRRAFGASMRCRMAGINALVAWALEGE
ncbi:helix-turn-helix domain-containing protein [uncultured Pseudodesulfovibrio sp.]|uniref:TetR/AcrR family transcriptional regulator n=1 Tax=uncultured Pseudodesulfovibrio sp. TaxID=2035858 RepID=UPI0029C79838|nr:helix-turn-helix domain-containing protein [uncultured Pseudodesulfovibrio sp.]